ncbi:uncharacterized protein CCOS01_01081 [Colletotrichum costaricense]|uniref:Uncharacterized protein n=1 Tax=Colletotrichum costaricense TaxID=1209916 RepID=A0AAI9ZC50_9PEZI|nr:uncharacterized protein CCOS01_01081 [Colletotrichum costaricense]KAK1539767.1 hypothetical protein CCOS01_01081 [Colletotrichum costaricense]
MEGEAASTCCCFTLLSMLYLFLPPGSCCFQIARNRNLDPYCASSCASLGLRRAISEALRRAAPLPTSSSTSCSQPGDTASHGINLDQSQQSARRTGATETLSVKQSSNAAIATVIGALLACLGPSSLNLETWHSIPLAPLPHDERSNETWPLRRQTLSRPHWATRIGLGSWDLG